MPLISTIAEFKSYIAIDANMKWASLLPYVKEAEVAYLVPLLGKEFYDEFLPLYEDSVGEGPALSAENAALLPYIQRCLAYYSVLKALPHLTTSLGELGLRVHRSEDSDPAARWKEEKTLLGALVNGDLHADLLLAFLEENAAPDITDVDWTDALTFNTDGTGAGKYCMVTAEETVRYWQTKVDDNINNEPPTDPEVTEDDNWVEVQNPGKYQTWFASTANTRLSGAIVYSTAITQAHIDISNSRRVFLQLSPTITKLESKYLPRLVGQEQYDELIGQITNDTISAENGTLIALIAPIIAKRALYMRIPFMQVGIGADGIRLYSEVTEIRSKDYLATREQIKELRAALIDEEELGYLADENELKQFILDNADDYPLIKASTAYTVQPDPGPTWDSLNDPDSKHYAV